MGENPKNGDQILVSNTILQQNEPMSLENVIDFITRAENIQDEPGAPCSSRKYGHTEQTSNP